MRDVEHAIADVSGDARRLGERTAPSGQCIPEEENRVLRELRGDTRLRFSDGQRRILAAKGKKKLKEKDVIKAVNASEGIEKDVVKKALRGMIDIGRIMYAYAGGASSVEIPSEEYLREKGLIK